MKNFMKKVMAIGLTAIFTAGSLLPAQAMPVASVQAPVVGQTNSNVIQVQDDRFWRQVRPIRPGDNRNWRGGDNRNWRGDNNWRGRNDRNWGGGRGWQDDRSGYYRGHRGYRDYRRGYRQHNGYWFPLAAFATGAIIGGAIASDPAPVYRGGGNSNINPRHYDWCANRYRSYDRYSNSFQPYNGPRQVCTSPYY